MASFSRTRATGTLAAAIVLAAVPAARAAEVTLPALPTLDGSPSRPTTIQLPDLEQTVQDVTSALPKLADPAPRTAPAPEQATPVAPAPAAPTATRPRATSPRATTRVAAPTTPARRSAPTAGSRRRPAAAPRQASRSTAGRATRPARASSPTGAGGSPAAPGPQRRPSLSTRVFDRIEEAPLGLLVATGLIALLGIAMAGRSALTARRNARLRRQRNALHEDVGALQAALLPPAPAAIGEVDISVVSRSADGPASGGDFHDMIELDAGRVGFVIGDASGHGRDALAMTGLVHYTVRAYLEAGMAPREALRMADRALGTKLGETLVTVTCGVYDPASSRLTYAVAGHPAPLILGGGRDHAIELLSPTPLGLGVPTGFRQTSVPIRHSSWICLFTDGATEARLPNGTMLEREGLQRLAEEGGDATRMLERLRSATTSEDDVTLCLAAPRAAKGQGPVTDEIDLAAAGANPARLAAFCEACGVDAGEVTAAADAAGGEGLLTVEREGGVCRWRLEPAATPALATPVA